MALENARWHGRSAAWACRAGALAGAVAVLGAGACGGSVVVDRGASTTSGTHTGAGGAGGGGTTAGGSGGAGTLTGASGGAGGAATGGAGMGGHGGAPLVTCADGIKNGSETDKDCGGSCPACANGLKCGVNADCQSNTCAVNVCGAPAPTCADGMMNGNETDKDCGGSCPGCVDGLKCGVNADCQSNTCTANVCAAPAATCNDGIKNGSETDKDCGGSCPGCADGLKCGVNADCQSIVCKANLCAVPTCSDGVQNQGEAGVDCGGPCAACGGQYGVPGQSCNGGLDCGGVSCCQSILVPGGTFPMGRSAGGTDAYADSNPDEQPEHKATVADYYLDTFEVTVGRFRKFVAAFNGTPPAVGAGAHPLIANSGWQAGWNASLAASQAALISKLKCSAAYQTWTDAPGANETYAINCVSWYEATAFCAWDGGRMPTEAEWEYASAGGSDNRRYPWGATDPSVTKALANDWYSDNSPFIAVGSHPSGNGKWGHRDLAGAMWEWNLDWYDLNWYSGAGHNCSNCANINQSSYRVNRGGGWYSGAWDLRAAERFGDTPSGRDDLIGLRCSRTAP